MVIISNVFLLTFMLALQMMNQSTVESREVRCPPNVPNPKGNGLCVCPPDYKSYRCQYLPPCQFKPCQNGGTCTEGWGAAAFVPFCACPPGYTGEKCEKGSKKL